MRWLVLLPLLLGACSVTPGEVHERVQEARACNTGDSCVFTEVRGCLCASPVNATKVDELNALLKKVDCGGVVSTCADTAKAACVEGRCTEVKEPEKPAEAPAVRPQLLAPRAIPGPMLPGGPGRVGAPLKLR